MNKRFGWHSGTLTCRNAIIKNDMTIEGDMSFGDATTDTLTVNGLFVSDGDVATSINVTGTPVGNGLDAAAVFQHGSYNTAIAHGTQTGHLVLNTTNITADTGAYYVFGSIDKITTSDDSTGYMNPSYGFLSVGHNLVNGWAVRGRVDITDTCEIGEMAGLLGTMEVTASKIITQTGAPPLAAAILSATIGASATVEQEVMCLEIRPLIKANIAGSSAGIRVNVNCSSTNYLDYGIDIRSMSANQTAAMRILFTGASASLPAAIVIEGQGSSTSVVTSAIKIQGSATYFADFSVSTDAAPFTKTSSEKTGSVVGLLAVKDQDGSTAYINCYA